MAQGKANIIKLGNGNVTYIPITSTQAVQHKYGSSEPEVLDSYLGNMSGRISQNAADISTLASAVINTYTKIVDYENSYVKPVSGHADQIMVYLPTTGENKYQETITINNVAHATAADTATNLSAKEIKYASSTGTVSYTIGNYTGSFEAKADTSSYGFVKFDSAPTEGSGNTVTSGTLYSALDGKADDNHTHGLEIKTKSDYVPTTDSVNVITYFDKTSVELGTTTQSFSYTRASVPTTQYVDNTFLTKDEFETFSASGMHYKGDTATIPSNPTSGDVYHVTTKITSGLGTDVTAEVGDFITYYKPEGAANGSWSVWDRNVDGAIYSGNNTLTDGQMLVADGTTGKVKTQAIPTVSVSGGGTGNVVKTISDNDDHSISYSVGYAVDTLDKASGSDNSGVLTNITITNNKLTVTYTDASSNFSGGSTLKTVTGYTQNASGKITNVTFGDIPIMVGTTNGGGAGTKGLVPAPAAGDVTATVVKVLGADGNWKTVSAQTPELQHNISYNLNYAVGNEIDFDISKFGSFSDGPNIISVAPHAAAAATVTVG